jgi:rRNA-processing protein FCF1
MEVLLDTNFIISCVLKRIDFVEELRGLGFHVKVPKSVLQEMKDLKTDKKVSHGERQAIDVAFAILEERKIRKARIGGSYVDDGLIQKGREGVYIATLDKAIKHSVPNKVVIDTAKNTLKIERN